jgi:hypothetical protein
VSITNHGTKTRHIEVTSYAELVLAPAAADAAHPAFSNLFVETESLPELDQPGYVEILLQGMWPLEDQRHRRLLLPGQVLEPERRLRSTLRPDTSSDRISWRPLVRCACKARTIAQ